MSKSCEKRTIKSRAGVPLTVLNSTKKKGEVSFEPVHPLSAKFSKISQKRNILKQGNSAGGLRDGLGRLHPGLLLLLFRLAGRVRPHQLPGHLLQAAQEVGGG